MVSRQKFCHRFHRLADSITIRSRRVHGKDFHPIFDLVLARRQKFAFRGPTAALLAVDLHDAKSADRDWRHVWLMAQNRDGNFLLISQLLHVKLPRRIENGRIARCGAPFQIHDNVPTSIRQGLC